MTYEILNYLQNVQQMQNKQMPQMQTQNTYSNYNPFDAGIAKAIESARESLGMNQAQQDNALRQGIFKFGQQISQTPKSRGFLNNLGDIANALNPALEAYGIAENTALKENEVLANKILEYQAKERKNALDADDNAWERDYKNKVFAETQRYHNLMNNFQKMKYDQKQGVNSASGQEFVPISSKQERNNYIKDRKGLGTVLHEVNNLEKLYNTFDKSQMLPLGRLQASGENLLTKFMDSEDLRKTRATRDNFKSATNKFVASSERTLRGGGVLGPQIIKLFKEQGIYPDYSDTPESFKTKLDTIKQEIQNNYDAATLSLKYGVQLTPMDLEHFKDELQQNTSQESDESKSQNPQNMIKMRHQDTGEEYEVPQEYEKIFNEQGYEKI